MPKDIKKEMESEDLDDLQKLIDDLPEDSKRFTDHILNIPRFVRLMLTHRGKSQNDISEYLGKSEAEISKWLSGRQNMTLRTISRLEAALSIDIINPKIKLIVDNLKNSYKRRSPIKSYKAGNVINLFVLQDPQNVIERHVNKSFVAPHKSINLSLSDHECNS